MITATRTGWAWPLAVSAVAAAVGASLTSRPAFVLSAVAAGLLVVSAARIPRDRVIGAAASFAFIVVAVFPPHLVPTVARYGELALLVVLAIMAAATGRVRRVSRLMLWLAAGYLTITWISTHSRGIEGAGVQFTMHAIVGMSFILMGATATRRDRRTIASTLMGLALLEAAYGLFEIAATPGVIWASPVPEAFEWPASRLPNEILPGLLRAQGTFGHPLLFATLLLVGLGVALRYEFYRPILRVGTVALLMAGSVAAGSRSITLVMLVMVLFFWSRRHFTPIRGTFLVVLLGLAASTNSFTAGVFERFASSGSVSHRAGALDAVPNLLDQTPLRVLIGNGWYSEQQVYREGLLQRDGFMAIDNQFVGLLVTAGLIGLVLFSALLVVAVVRGRPDYRIASIAAVCLFVVFNVLEFPATWALVALLLGLAASPRDETLAVEPLEPDTVAARP